MSEEEGFSFKAHGKSGILGLIIASSIPFLIGLVIGLLIG